MHLIQLLVQVAVVLAVARLVGALFRRFGQPQVVGEMAAGLLLGPSVLGWTLPAVSAALFPPESLPALSVLSQVGLLLFVFLVGVELEPAHLRGRGRTAVATSFASIAAPFALALGAAPFLYGPLAGEGVGFWPFALFLGAAMSVTAFPVLARILTERDLLGTRLGAVAIACAAVDDVSAWALLAAVTAVAKATGPGQLLVLLGGTAAFVAAMLFVVRPLLRRVEALYLTRGRLTNDLLALVLGGLLLAAAATEGLGVHALFGAFLFGAVLPKDRGLVHAITVRIESLTVVLFLPLFFAFTGLRTSVGLLDTPGLWVQALVVLGIAVVGKFAGSALAARATGLAWREASALGILMNTRGLMELVFVTIGLELGVISPALFAMMVLMALVTTFMTTPVLDRLVPARLLRARANGDEARPTILLPVALPSSGPALLDAARALTPPGGADLLALHLTRAADGPLLVAATPDPPDPLAPLRHAAEGAGVAVKTLAFVSRDVGQDIVDVAESRGADLVLMGWHQPILSESILGGAVADVLRRVDADVAVLVARTAAPWTRVLVPYAGTAHDRAALRLARRLAAHEGVTTTLLHVVAPGRSDEAPRLGLADTPGLPEAEGVRRKVVEAADALDAVVVEARAGYDLVVVGASEQWGLRPTLFSRRHERLARGTPATLLIVRGREGEG